MTYASQPIRWGIIGCGRIAEKFCRSMAAVPDGIITACASRTPGKAGALARTHNIPFPFDDYEAMLTDGQVDAVYIATTHNFHLENMLLCFAHGKHVLCEKPLTVSEAESAEAAAAARSRGCFLMEAMWTRFLPAIRRMKTLLDEGAIGEVLAVRADFCVRAPFDPENRLYNPALAGGALLDLGVYPVSMASHVMGGPPASIQSVTHLSATGVDERNACLFDYGNGRMAMLSFSLSSPSRNRLEVCGTEGMLIVPESFLSAKKLEIHRNGKIETEDHPYPDPEGFRFQIEAVHASLRRGETECTLMPLDESVTIMQTMDRIRSQF